MKTLEEYRKEIDEIDIKILDLLARRFNIVREIGKCKKEKGLPVIDKTREAEKIACLIEEAKKLNLGESVIKNIWSVIFNEAYQLEK